MASDLSSSLQTDGFSLILSNSSTYEAPKEDSVFPEASKVAGASCSCV
uniref:Uncharacterized protein n=1 Tax=Anguilla anguilla TaxID=7936 RepID=A0A0E9XM53_ANGAN